MSLLHLNLYFIFLVTWFRVKVLHYTAQVYIEILGILPYHPRCNMPDSIGTFFEIAQPRIDSIILDISGMHILCPCLSSSIHFNAHNKCCRVYLKYFNFIFAAKICLHFVLLYNHVIYHFNKK